MIGCTTLGLGDGERLALKEGGKQGGLPERTGEGRPGDQDGGSQTPRAAPAPWLSTATRDLRAHMQEGTVVMAQFSMFTEGGMLLAARDSRAGSKQHHEGTL